MPSSLVVQTSFIGDVILTTPLIAKLAETGAVDVVTTPVGATVLANNPHIRRVIPYDKQRRDRGVAGFARAAMRARERVSDRTAISPSEANAATHTRERRDTHTFRSDRCAYLAQGSLRSAALALTAQCSQRTGFDTSGGRVLYTHAIPYRDDWHHARRLLSLADEAYAATVDTSELRPRLYPGTDDVTAVDTLVRGRTRPLVAMAPGSVWATKRWPYYGELSRRLGDDFDIAIVGGSDDLGGPEDMLRRVNLLRIVDARGKLSLLGSAELLRRAVVVVTNDSAPQHLASAMGTPTVTVFGPTVPGFGFGPLAPMSRAVGQDGLACRPCDRHGPRRCPLGHWKCMRDVSVAAVYDAVRETMRQGVVG